MYYCYFMLNSNSLSCLFQQASAAAGRSFCFHSCSGESALQSMALSPYMILESRFFNFLCAQKGDKQDESLCSVEPRAHDDVIFYCGGRNKIFVLKCLDSLTLSFVPQCSVLAISKHAMLIQMNCATKK